MIESNFVVRQSIFFLIRNFFNLLFVYNRIRSMSANYMSSSADELHHVVQFTHGLSQLLSNFETSG